MGFCRPTAAIDAVSSNCQWGVRERKGGVGVYGVMEKPPVSSNDNCPFCRVPLEIAGVKIKLVRVVLISVCPNCGFVQAEKSGQGSRPARRKQRALLIRKGKLP